MCCSSWEQQHGAIPISATAGDISRHSSQWLSHSQSSWGLLTAQCPCTLGTQSDAHPASPCWSIKPLLSLTQSTDGQSCFRPGPGGKFKFSGAKLEPPSRIKVALCCQGKGSSWRLWPCYVHQDSSVCPHCLWP